MKENNDTAHSHLLRDGRTVYVPDIRGNNLLSAQVQSARVTMQECEEYAGYIQKCVNSHAALVKAAQCLSLLNRSYIEAKPVLELYGLIKSATMEEALDFCCKLAEQALKQVGESL